MAKKTAPKKKAAPIKPTSKAAAKPAKKPAKPVVKQPSKPAVKAVAKPVKKAVEKTVEKPVAAKKSEPAMMTKKGREVAEEKTPAKAQTVVSMIEDTSATDEPAKAEKVSKVKPVKIERGNLADEKAKWAELYKKYGKEKAVSYKMSETFATMIPMQHKVLGWGFVLTNENDRLEVLFETGIRILISNYKSS